MSLQKIKSELDKLGNKERAVHSARFFKTGKGQYGEGDIFLGITVPKQREVAKKIQELDFKEIGELLKSKIHEHRFTALEVLVIQYEKAEKHKDTKKQKQVFDFYIRNLKRANNWDLVDTSAPYIAGEYLKDKSRDILYKLAKSKNLWEKRVAIVSTSAFIKNGYLTDTFKICEILMGDGHDLIHKACGWMLREAGKKNIKELENFLNEHAHHMPRTMLRYAIERMDATKRKNFLVK